MSTGEWAGHFGRWWEPTIPGVRGGGHDFTLHLHSLRHDLLVSILLLVSGVALVSGVLSRRRRRPGASFAMLAHCRP